MGNAANALSALDCSRICSDCSRFVCNACSFHSECCWECFKVEFVTTEIEVPDDVSEMSVEVSDFCSYRRKS